MKRYIFAERHGVYILDLQQTLGLIDQAYDFVKETVAHGGNILFVGTKKQAQETIAEQATRVGMPYVNHRWLGGMLTNFATVSKRVDRMKELEEIDFEDVAGSGRTKKELLLLERELRKLQSSLGGIRDMNRTPSAVWVIDTEKEHLAVDEANKLGIPVIAMLDTNANPDDTTYPIPSNDDSIRSVSLLTRVIADAVAAGILARQGQDAASPMAEWERDLLGAQQVEDATEQHAQLTEITVMLEAIEQTYPNGIVTEIELEDDRETYEIEVVFENKLHELKVTTTGDITVDEVEDDDKDIHRAARITVGITRALRQALELHPDMHVDSIELDDQDGHLIWEIELQDPAGNEIDMNIDAATDTAP